MTSDPTPLLFFSLFTAGALFLVMLIFKEIGRAMAMMISFATIVFCVQQAIMAYSLDEYQLLAQAVGSSIFFGGVIFSQVHQMIFAPRGSSQPIRTYED